MKGGLPARHLLRRYVVFTLTLMFLLSMARLALGLWHLDELLAADALLPVFLTGLRFDLALCGILLFVPVAAGTLLALFKRLLPLARLCIVGGLLAGLLLTLLAEFITPVFINETGLRPDLASAVSLGNPLALGRQYAYAHPLPLAIGISLVLLIMLAFVVRLEPGKLLRQRLNRISGLMLWAGGTLACVLAVASGHDPLQPWLSPSDAIVSTDASVNELALNSLYKTLYQLVRTP